MNRVIAACILACLPISAYGATLQGEVFDSTGLPIAGARVGIPTAAPRKGQAMFCPSCYLDCAKSAQTDSKGRFQIPGLSDSLKFHVLVTATGQKSQLTKLIDPLIGDLGIQLMPLPPELPAARTVRGRVIDDKKRPVRGALVSPAGAKTSSRRWYGQVSSVDPSVCDTQGRFAMLLPEDYRAVDVEVTADGKAGIAVRLLEPGADEREITIPTGTRVTGRLVYQGRPIEGLRIAVVQLERSGERLFIKAVPDATDKSGRFNFNYLPANERYAIYTLVGDGATENRDLVLSTKLFTAKDNNVSRDLGDLEVQPAVHLRGRVELGDGVFLPADTKLVISRDPAWDLIAIPLASDGSYTVNGLPPETYELRIAARGFEIDSKRMHYQSLGPQSFGIHITNSVDDLRIPVVKK